MVGQTLGQLRVAEPSEAIVVTLEVGSALSLKLSGQPLAAVQTDLDIEGKPGLDAGVDPPELGMDVVLVEMEALARPQFQPALAAILGEVVLEAAARLHDGEHANQPRVDGMLLKQLLRKSLFVGRTRG